MIQSPTLSRSEGAARSRDGAPAWFRLAAGIAIALSLGLSLTVTSPRGIGLSPDSVSYLAAARNLAAGEGFRSFDGQPVTLWPPLYPALLAALHGLTGAELLATGRWLHAGLLIATLGLTTALAVRLASDEWLVALTIIGVAGLSPFLWPFSALLLSEGLFACLVLLLVMALAGDRPGWRAIAFGGVIAAALGLTRYIGIAFVVAGALALVLGGPEPPARRALKAALFTSVAALPWLLWLGRNAWLYGSAMGPRYPSVYGLGENLRFTLETLLQMILAGPLARPAIAATLLLPAAVAAALVLRRSFAPPRPGALKLRRTLLIFISVYLAFLIATSTTSAYDRISVRLVMPVFAPLILLLGDVAAGVLRRLRATTDGRALRVLAGGAALLVVGMAAARGVEEMGDMRATGLGYHSANWAESPTLALAIANRALLESERVFSNDPPALYLYLDLIAEETPRRTAHNSTAILVPAAALDAAWPPAPGVVVWFAANSGDTDFYALDDLAAAAEMSPLAAASDGALYRVASEP